MSLKLGKFPSIWKLAHVVPVFKSGDKNSVISYRPISLLSIPTKIFESIVTDKLFNIFRHVIVDKQHGFFRGRSTLTNLLSYTDYIMDAFESGSEVHSIYFDFSKAFDSVNHWILIHKLRSYGVNGNLLLWLNSYLTERKQQVKLLSFLSHSYTVPSGVPQGSNIGPLLFLIFVNDIGNSLRSQFLLYADDIKIFTKISSQVDKELLQSDISSITAWCFENDMSINCGKTFCINFSRKIQPSQLNYSVFGEMIVSKSSCKDLGVILDAKMTFCNHYDYMSSKSFRMLGCVKRYTASFTNIRCIIVIYNAYVRSIHDYCCIIWNPHYSSHRDRLEMVQNKFLKYIRFKLGATVCLQRSNMAELMSYTGLTSLTTRRIYFQLCFCFKIVNNIIDVPSLLSLLNFNVPQFPARHLYMFKTTHRRTNYSQNRPIDNIMIVSNLFCASIDFHLSYATFQRSIRRILSDI